MSVHDRVSPSTMRPTPVARVVHRIAKAARVAWRASGHGFVGFYNSDNLTFAASIAYYSLLSLFPFVLLVLSITSRIAVGQDSATGQTLLDIVVLALPGDHEFLTRQVHGLAARPFNLSLAGTLITRWASMGVFGAVTAAVNHAWGVERAYGFLKQQLVAFLMLLAAGVLLIVALVLMSATEVVQSDWFAGVLARFPRLGDLSGVAFSNAPTPMFILVVGLIYYYVPNAKVRLRDVWFGAVLSGLLWRLTFAGFAWYVGDLSRFSVHGSVATVVVFLLWVYVSACILLYGAGVTAAVARLRKHLPQEAPAAPVRSNQTA